MWIICIAFSCCPELSQETYVVMETFVSFIFIGLSCGFVGAEGFQNNLTGNSNDIIVSRQKRFLVFEKGASFTVSRQTQCQGANIYSWNSCRPILPNH